jgi:hypothetical protein
LTAEVDPCSAGFVRFYHEHFQRDQPHLLTQIKRATKNDQQSKDEVDFLRIEVCDIKSDLRSTVTEFDRKLAELSQEYNRRVAVMNSEYGKLSALVQSLVSAQATPSSGGAYISNGNSAAPTILSSASQLSNPGAVAPFQPTDYSPGSGAAMSTANGDPPGINFLHSLSEAAVSLQIESERVKLASKASTCKGKRHSPDNGDIGNIKKAASRVLKRGKK